MVADLVWCSVVGRSRLQVLLAGTVVRLLLSVDVGRLLLSVGSVGRSVGAVGPTGLV